MLIFSAARGGKHGGGNARVAFHAKADHRHFGNVFCREYLLCADLFAHLFRDFLCPLKISRGHGKGYVGLTARPGVLNDHVHHDLSLGKGGENLG